MIGIPEIIVRCITFHLQNVSLGVEISCSTEKYNYLMLEAWKLLPKWLVVKVCRVPLIMELIQKPIDQSNP